MLSLFTCGISENRGRGLFGGSRSAAPVDINRLKIGRIEMLHAHLSAPLGLSAGAFDRAAKKAVDAMVSMGADEGVLPTYAERYALRSGLRRADDMSFIRSRAAEAAKDILRGRTGAKVKVFARMASRDVSECLCELATVCRYVTAEGGPWVESACHMLLREYGVAGCAGTRGEPDIAVVFDGGFQYGGEDAVIDLTRGELNCPNRVRPRVGERLCHGFPDCGFYDKSRLIAAAYARGAMEWGDVMAYCPEIFHLDR